MSENSDYFPGRLGRNDATLETDERADPRIVEALVAAGGLAPGLDEIDPEATYAECLAYCAAFEVAAAEGNALLSANLPALESVDTATEIIGGVDGNQIQLYVHRPRKREGRVPCIVHIHGGGMVLMGATDPMFVRWRGALADLGLVIIGVEFRNGGGRLGNHPFPAGLNDCASAVQWADLNRDELGISTIVISGESGGGNLSLATALKANQEGWIDKIDGVYACCPYICGQYGDPPKTLLSLDENDGYMLSCRQMAALVKVYDPTNEHGTNPLAWPYHAQGTDLEGLPPHVISVNELDPLRDEGLTYYRKLLYAGVSAFGRTVHGTPHAGDMGYPDITPEIYRDTLASIHGFISAL